MASVQVHVVNKSGAKTALTLDEKDERIGYLKTLVKRDELESVDVKSAEAEADEPGDYSGLKVPDLKAEIAKRNEGREEGDRISDEGNKPDLVAALTADDEK